MWKCLDEGNNNSNKHFLSSNYIAMPITYPMVQSTWVSGTKGTKAVFIRSKGINMPLCLYLPQAEFEAEEADRIRV
jgi:hypothetical protein